MTRLVAHNANVMALARQLHSAATVAAELAALARKDGRYEEAQELDRRAEALHCAAALAETRGM